MIKVEIFMVVILEAMCIQVLNANGEHLYSFHDKSIESESLHEHHSICIDYSELIYVSEWRSNHCASVFTKEGKFLALFGANGSDEGQFRLPSGVAFDCDGILCVCDQANSRLQLRCFTVYTNMIFFNDFSKILAIKFYIQHQTCELMRMREWVG